MYYYDDQYFHVIHGTLKHGKVKQFAQGHMINNWWS